MKAREKLIAALQQATAAFRHEFGGFHFPEGKPDSDPEIDYHLLARALALAKRLDVEPDEYGRVVILDILEALEKRTRQ